jgi:hypothetical protein
MRLLEIIREASKGTVEAGKPVSILYGTITNENPLEVNVDQRFPLSEDFLVVPESMTEFKVTIGVIEYVIRKGLKTNDKVILLRVQGGQQYIILDRVI